MQSDKQIIKIILSDESFNLIKSINPSFLDAEYDINDEDKSLNVQNIRDFLIALDDTILMLGLDEELKCNEYGKNLYLLYDEVLQKS